MAKTKRERVMLFIDKLQSLPPAASFLEVLQQQADAMEEVENAHSDAEPPSPDRMYAAAIDSRLKTLPNDVKRYRHTGHVTLMAPNGAIRIEGLDGKVWLAKPGQDGNHVP